MFRPEADTGPGDTIKLELAHPFDAITVMPIRGENELWIAGRRKPGMPAIALETLILNAGMIKGDIEPSQWVLGDRNRALLAVLCAGFGAPDELWATCPECHEMHEVPFDPGQILYHSPAETKEAGPTTATGPARMRLPVGADIEAAAGDGDALRERCAPEMPVGQFEAEIAARDPCAELRFSLNCVACATPFTGALDPVALLVTEFDRHGGVLAEIDLLARSYHWAEADLVALPAWRRRLYFRQQASERMAS